MEQSLQPTCAGSCPLCALEFGPVDELRARYDNRANITPLPDSGMIRPNLIIKANRHARPTGETPPAIS